jgi:Chemotaxis signal transduction protein
MSTAALDAYFEELLAPVATPSADVEMPPPANDPRPETPSRPIRASQAFSPPAQPTSTIRPGRWLRVTVDGDHYALELLRVQEVARVAPVVALRGAAPAVLGAMNLRGRIVPVFDLGRWLGAGEVQPDERARVVVIERHDELIGLLVSAVDDVTSLDADAVEIPFDASRRQRRNIDRAFLGIARPADVPTVLLDAAAFFG